MAHLVTAIIKPFKIEEVKEALRAAGILGLTISEVQGFGRQGGKSETFRGSEYKVEFVPKVKLEILIESAQVDKIMSHFDSAEHTRSMSSGWSWPSCSSPRCHSRPSSMHSSCSPPPTCSCGP